MFPIATHRPATEPGRTAVEYAPGAIGLNAERDSNESDDKASTTRNLWTLVRDGASAPGSFICPSTDDQKSDIDDPLVCWDFGTTYTDCTAGLKGAFMQVSYGYQVPYGQMGQPRADRDQHMALAADRGPFSPALELGEKHPGAPAAESEAPEDWAAWNSPNHGGQGQNVLFADSHAEFQTKPTVGVDDDNIYTRWTKPDDEDLSESNRMNGTPPTGREAPLGETDSLIYP
jgi:prepilin-type processing-associated H-X9-DG protein